MKNFDLRSSNGFIPMWVRFLIKATVLYFIIYLEVDLYSTIFVLALLVIAEITEVYANYVVKHNPQFLQPVSMLLGWMNIIVAFVILQFTGYLSSDLYALAFVVVMLASVPSGIIGGLTNGLLASAMYILMVSSSLPAFEAMFRAFMFLAISTITGVLAESGNRSAKQVEELQEQITHKSEANDLKDNFLKLTHHSLRTPMTAIKGYASALEDPDLSKEERDMYFHYMQDSIKTMNALIENVFSVLRVEEDFELDLQEVDVIKLTKEVIKELTPLTKEQKVKIDFKPEQDRLLIKLDKSKMQVALKNIVDNAIRYSKENSTVHITIKDSLTHIDITVKDEGQGIKREELPYLFEKFHRINVLTPDSEGLGIGLYYANRIVEKHNGKIDVKSKEGQGTTVSITIPKATGRSLFEGVGT